MRLPVVGPPVPDIGNSDKPMGGRIGDGKGRFPYLQPLDCGGHSIGPGAALIRRETHAKRPAAVPERPHEVGGLVGPAKFHV